VYNFALPPLVLHSFATGNAGVLSRWAAELTLPSSRVSFFNFLASHDGIGLNPARGILTGPEIDALVARTLAHGGFISFKHLPDGTRAPYELNINFLDALSNPAGPDDPATTARKLLTAHAILYCLPGMPGVYCHSLFGSRGDRPGAEVSGIPRRINRQRLDVAQLEAALREPGSLAARVFTGQRALLGARRRLPALAPDASHQVLHLDPRLFVVRRRSHDGGDAVLAVNNVSPDPVTLTTDQLERAGHQTEWVWGREAVSLTGDQVVVEPYGAFWLSQTPGSDGLGPGRSASA
jgi:sucrose phosphorylase